MLENLDLLTNEDLVRHEADWEALEVIPAKAYEDPKAVGDATAEPTATPKSKSDGDKK